MTAELRFRQKVQKRIRDLAAGVIGRSHGMPLDVPHQPFEIVARIGDADYTDCCPLPGFARVKFCHGHVEMIAQAVLNAAHHLTLVFQRMGALDANLEREIRDHDSLCCTTSRIPAPRGRGFSSGTMMIRFKGGAPLWRCSSSSRPGFSR